VILLADDVASKLFRVGDKIYIIEGVPALYVEELDAIVLADIHLGYEEAMAKQGVYLPRMQLNHKIDVVRRARDSVDASVLVIDGDLKHEFSRLLRQEKLETAQFLTRAFQLGFKRIIVVRGNHDNYIKNLVTDLGGEFVEDLELNDILITHGHKNLEEPGRYNYVIIGHEHPALQVNVGGAKTKFPVFLLAPLKEGGRLIVLPAAGKYQLGNNISLDKSAYLSPITREHAMIEEAVPVIVDEQEGLMPLVKLSLLATMVSI
jgi:putative SbcD/Mre11-related phosphoesterase